MSCHSFCLDPGVNYSSAVGWQYMCLTSVRLLAGMHHPEHRRSAHYILHSLPPLLATTMASPALLVPGVFLSLQSISRLSHYKLLWCLRQSHTVVEILGLMKNKSKNNKTFPFLFYIYITGSFMDLFAFTSKTSYSTRGK